MKEMKIKFKSFILLYSFLTLIFYNFFFWNKVFNSFSIKTFSDIIFILSYFTILASLHIILYLIFCNKYTTKFICIFFLIINSGLIYFMNTYSIHIDFVMLQNALETDRKEVLDLLNYKLALHIIFFGIIPSILLLKLKIEYKEFKKEFLERFLISFLLFIFCLILVFSQYRKISTFVRSTNDDFGYLLPRNYVYAVIKKIKSNFKKEKSFIKIGNDLEFKNKKDNTLVIFIVGETARNANFSLYDYKRETNPLLKKEKISVLKNSISCGTSTGVSLPCIFSHLEREEFVKNDKNYEFLPSILSRKGIKVLYKENNFGGCKDTCFNTDTFYTNYQKNSKYCKNEECVDGIMLDGVEKYIQDNKNKMVLVILHQNGSHGPRYNRRYLKEFEKFKPICDDNDLSKCSKEELVNTFDNTILYTDYFISNVIKIAKKSNRKSAVIYASDHGESLGENGIYLHGFPYNIAPKEQKEIPFIVWISDKNKKCIKKFEKYSHDNIFHSILGLFDAKTELYNEKLDIFDTCK